jgi:hypothetical protein
MPVKETGNKPVRVGDGTPGPGRPKGIPNKATVAAKQAFQMAFDGIGGVDALIGWAQENQTDFFKLFSKLIPQDVNASVTLTQEEALKELR